MRTDATIAVVGATGFVGRSLSKYLLDARPGRIRLYSRGGDTLAGRQISAIPVNASDFRNIDVVIHLAGIAHRKATEAEYKAVNVDLAMRTAELAHAAGVRRFVFVSSMLVHGRWSDAPLSPEGPYHPKSPFARSKVEAEQRLQAFAARSGLDLAIVRSPLIYGPEAKGNFALLARAARHGLPLPLGCAAAQRSMVSLQNFNDAILTLASRPVRPSTSTILLPADERDLTVRQTYLELCRAADRPGAVLNVPAAAMRLALTSLGRTETFESLFKPLLVDRSHWEQTGWSPPQPVSSGLKTAIA
ncbi:MAG: NAD-dependent epimerase/dehydratase family protein [Brevundimonas sp.]|uniref:NAD-dependent epimerase/dehydratase family protein n=1 Tax=Brevundimonas sp. TaxID=1871086 RepID=UPI00248A6AA8|nr:NAD-dependent epimerase/dehydratase family protein [Brevundimonas sp.]MDI1325507.1 NAD-dependent epimerase/dehydratase family protein [Brevundimonas sp.]